MFKKFTTWFLLVLLAVVNSFGQEHEPAVIQGVSVDTGQNGVTLDWEVAASEGVLRYVVYQGRQGSEPLAADAVDSVDAGITTYTHQNTSAYSRSVPYTVAAVYPDDTSPLADYHHTIYTSATYDSCNGSLLIDWTQYIGWGDDLFAYNVYIRQDYGDFLNIPSFSTDTFQYQYKNVTENAQYCIYVEAENKNFLTSTSNMFCINTTRSLAPSYINADYATVTKDRDIQLSFTYDPNTQLNDFELFMGNAKDEVIIGIEDFNSETSGNFIYTHDVFKIDQPVYYQLAAVDLCPERNPVKFSNVASNIVLTTTENNLLVQLDWTEYNTWLGGVDSYYLNRVTNNTTVEVIDSFSSEARTTSDNIAFLISDDQLVNDQICYYIRAVEGAGNPYGIRGSSQSNIACITISPEIHMPNAFTPDGNGINDKIKPKLTFRPDKYLFLVTDRWGSRVFESTDPDAHWSGDIMGGKKAPEGIYVYFLKITTTAGLVFEKRGHITLFYP